MRRKQMKVINKTFVIFEGEKTPTEFYEANTKLQGTIQKLYDEKRNSTLVVDFNGQTMAPSSFWGVLGTALRSSLIESIELVSVQSSIKLSIERVGFNKHDKIKVFPMFQTTEVEVID
jgi:anti-anti-sigma regulatory factor